MECGVINPIVFCWGGLIALIGACDTMTHAAPSSPAAPRVDAGGTSGAASVRPVPVTATRVAPVTATRVAEPLPVRGPSRAWFGKDRFALVTDHGLRVWPITMERPLTIPVDPQPNGIGALTDGSLLGVSTERLCRLAPAANHADCHAFDINGPLHASHVWSAEKENRVWVLHDDMAARYEIPRTNAALVYVDELKLGAGVRDAFTPTENGVLWSDGAQLRLAVPGQAERLLALPPRIQASLLASGGSETAWLAAGNLLHRVTLGGQLTIGPPTDMGGRIISLSATATHIALLVAASQPNGQWQWSIVLLDGAGKELSRTASPFQPFPAQADHQVVLSRFAPLVAIAGREQAAVLDLSGKVLGKTDAR